MPDDAKAFKEFIFEKEGLKLERKQRKEVCEIFSGLRLDTSDLTGDPMGGDAAILLRTLMMSRNMERSWHITERRKSQDRKPQIGTAHPFLRGK